MLFFDGTRLKSFAVTQADCLFCHTQGIPGVFDPQKHAADHDNAFPDSIHCSNEIGCHGENVMTEHTKKGWSCATCHNGETLTLDSQGVIDAVQLSTGSFDPETSIYCSTCHGEMLFDEHSNVHDQVFFQRNPSSNSLVCTECHWGKGGIDPNQAGMGTIHWELTSTVGCSFICHDRSDYVFDVINMGRHPSNQPVYCSDCHLENKHHLNAEAVNGNCTACHTDPRLMVDATAPVGQLACRQCHVDSSGFVQTGAGKPSHAFNTNGSIQDFGACFACHQPMPYHAKPTAWPGWYEENQPAPGRTTFNLFHDEFKPNCAPDCESHPPGRSGYDEGRSPERYNDRNWSSPTISYSMITFFDYFDTNQQWTVPIFGSGGGGTTPPPPTNDSVTITQADYDQRSDRLRVYAENTLGRDATLSLSYDGNTYQMDWNSYRNRWEISLRIYRCNDSTVDVLSSAGGSDTANVANCSSSWSGWRDH